MRNLTQDELSALSVTHNLCDGHAYRRWSPAENALISRAPSLFRHSDRTRRAEIEAAYVERFLGVGGQSVLPAHFTTLMVFTASTAIEMVANHLRLSGMSAALVEPCFDNLPDILRRHRVPLRPVPEDGLDAGGPWEDADALFLVSPNNPTGTAIEPDRFTRLLDVCRARRKLLVLDACFRLHLPEHATYDQYRMLADADVDCVVIEDTGKVWPTFELKAPFLRVSPRLAEPMARLHSDFLLHVSPFTVRLLTAFAEMWPRGGRDHLRRLVAANRAALLRAVAGAAPHPGSSVSGPVLRPVDTGFLALAWLAVEPPDVDAAEVRDRLAERGVRVLSGERFHWSSPERGRRHLRVALLRDEDVFAEAARRIETVCREIGYP